MPGGYNGGTDEQVVGVFSVGPDEKGVTVVGKGEGGFSVGADEKGVQ